MARPVFAGEPPPTPGGQTRNALDTCGVGCFCNDRTGLTEEDEGKKRRSYQLDRAWACWAAYSFLYEAHMESEQMQHVDSVFPITERPRATASAPRDFTSSVIAAASRWCRCRRRCPVAAPPRVHDDRVGRVHANSDVAAAQKRGKKGK